MKKKLIFVMLLAMMLTGCSSQSYRSMEYQIESVSRNLSDYSDAVYRYEEAMAIIGCYLYEEDETITFSDAIAAYDEVNAAVQELIDTISDIEHSIE